MRNIAVVADAEGRGYVNPFKHSHIKHTGELFYIANHPFEIGKDNTFTIPAEIMNELGYLRKDGKRAFVIVPTGRHDAYGNLHIGGEIQKSPSIERELEKVYNGGQLPNTAFRPSDKEKYGYINPESIPEYELSK